MYTELHAATLIVELVTILALAAGVTALGIWIFNRRDNR